MRFLRKASGLVCVVTAVAMLGAATSAWAQEVPDEGRAEEPVTTTTPAAPPSTQAPPTSEAPVATQPSPVTEPAPVAIAVRPRPAASSKFTIVLDSVPNSPQDVTFTATTIAGTSFGAAVPFVLDDDAKPTNPLTGHSNTKVFTVPKQINGSSIAMLFGFALPTGWSFGGVVCSRASDFPPAILYAAQNGDVTCTFKIVKRQPDVQIKKAKDPVFSGNNVYCAGPCPAQQKTQSVKRGGKGAVFQFRFQNDGKKTDKFGVFAGGALPSSGITVRYFIGATDVTSSLSTRIFTLAPGALSPVVTMKITASATAINIQNAGPAVQLFLADAPAIRDTAEARINVVS